MTILAHLPPTGQAAPPLMLLRSRFGAVWIPTPPPPLLSERARALGLETAADVEAEYQAARQGWSRGRCWHCPLCDVDFCSVSGARKHMDLRAHRVLRLDWYSDLPASLRCVRPHALQEARP